MAKNRFMRKVILIFIIWVSASFLVFFILYNKAVNKPIKSAQDNLIIEVKKGQGFYDILNKLDSSNNIRNNFMIKLNLSINKRKIELQEGAYEISSNCTLNEFIEALEGKNQNRALIKLTIPEGYTIEDIADTLEEKEIASKEEFIDAITNYELPWFVEKDESSKYNLEGYLYPDTYFIQKNTKVNQIIKMMLDRFEEVLGQIQEETDMSISKDQIKRITTIGSIVEKEAKVSKDRKLISSVIYNRLNKNMKLQIDATVIYAIGEHVDVVLYKHLKKDSPYNTYMYKGLPQGPICSPGKESLMAALKPSSTDYIYYILEKDGSHYFTDNYNDFLSKKKELGY